VSTGIDWDGPSRQPCVCGTGSPRTKPLMVWADDGNAFCHRCRENFYRDEAPPAHRPARPVARPVATVTHETLSDWGRELYDGAVALHGTVGAKYLQARGCVLPPADGDLRFHPALRHQCGYTGPGLLALVTDAVSRQARTLHRTWINADGTKANVDPPRMLLGGHRKAGGVIRLWPDEAVTTGLAVAEGIETALSLAHSYRPAWACIDAGNLAALPVLPGIECLVIGADHDEAGLRAAEACAERWEAAGVDVVAIAPQTARSDWNDARAAA
jgi:putative DNA primase/helicase